MASSKPLSRFDSRNLRFSGKGLKCSPEHWRDILVFTIHVPRTCPHPSTLSRSQGQIFSQSHALGWTSVCLYWRLSSEIIFLTSLLLLFLCLFVYKYLFPPLDGKPYGYDVVFQSLSCVWLFVILWTAVHQASLSFTISQSLLKFMSIQLVMLSNHLILCCPFSCPQFFPASGFFSNELALGIRWPKYWSFSLWL